MTKNNVGLAKEEHIRIHETVRRDLNFIKGILGMNSTHNEGDVVAKLVEMYKSDEIGKSPFLVTSPQRASAIKIRAIQTTLDEYKSLYEDSSKTNQTLVKAINHLCEKHNEKYGEIIQVVNQ